MISALGHMNGGKKISYTSEYVYVTFFSHPSSKNPIVHLDNGSLPVGYGGINSYIGGDYFESPYFSMGTAEKALAKAGFHGWIYVPVDVNSLGGVLLQVNGSTSGADCIVLGNQSIKRGAYQYVSHVTFSNGAAAPLTPHNLTISLIQRVLNVSDNMLPLEAFMKASGIRCIASGNFLKSVLHYANLSPNLSQLIAEGFLIVFPNKTNLTPIYQALYSEFSPHGYYPRLYILEPGFVKTVLYPKKTNYWRDLWGGILAFLPAIPLIGLVMLKESKEEEKLRKLLMVSGGNPVLIDVLTLSLVAVAVLITLLFIKGPYGPAMLGILAVVFSMRYYLRRVKLGNSSITVLTIAAIVASAFAFIVSSVYWLSASPYGWSEKVLNAISLALAYPFKVIGSFMQTAVQGTVFVYLPWIAGSLLLSFCLLLLFSRSNRLPWRVSARSTALTLAVMTVFAVYSGVVFSSPLTCLYQSTSAGNLGATIIIQITGAPEVYDALTSAINQSGGIYGSLWDVGEVVKRNGMFEVALYGVSAYGPSLIHYLRSARKRCRDARWLYDVFMDYRGKAIVYPYVLKDVQHNGSTMRFTLAGSRITNISVQYRVIHANIPVGGDVILPLSVVKAYNVTALPDLMLVYGGDGVLKAVKRVHEEYPGQFVYLSVEKGVKYMFSKFLKKSVALPLAFSTALIPVIGLVLGLRDGNELRRKRKLFEALGISRRELLLPLVAFLPLAVIAVPMLRDVVRFYSMGFVHSVWGFALLILPLVGMLLSPVIYVITVWRRCVK